MSVTKPIALDETLQAVNETLGEIRDNMVAGNSYAHKVVSGDEGNLTELTSDGDLADAGISVDDIVAIAEGKTATYVINISQNAGFNSQSDAVTVTGSLITTSGETVALSDIKKGDIILVTDTNVPDRWAANESSSSITFYKMETAKIDLTGYYTKTQTDSLLLDKADKVVGATSGHLAGLDSNGNLTDSDIPASDVTQLKNDLSQLDVHAKELQILGWQVPDECPVQNEISGDTLTQNVGRVDLGSLNWGYAYDAGYQYYPLSDVPNLKTTTLFLNGYTFVSDTLGWASMPNMSIKKHPSNTINWRIRDDRYTTVSDFKAAMSGKYLYYELATPISHSISNNVGLSNEALDIKMLGWSVPKECPVQNYMDANRKFHQRVGRVDLGNLEWRYDSSVTVFVSGNINCKNDGEGIPCYSYIYTQESGSNIVSTDKDKLVCVGSTYLVSNAVVVKNLSYTDAPTFKSAMQGVYLYYELANEIVSDIDGNEAIFNPLSGDLKFIAGTVNWDGVPEIFTIEQYSMYIVFVCTATQRAIYIVSGIGAQAAAVQVAGDSLASFSMNGFTVTANINRYCGYAIYRLMTNKT